MTETTPSIVIGLFEHRTDVAKAVTALLAADFHNDQVGFATRDDDALTSKAHKTEQIQIPPTSATATTDTTDTHPHSIMRGIVGGIMGALDMLLVPVTGPSEANAILESTLPIAEQTIDNLPHRHTSAPLAPATEESHTLGEREGISIVAGSITGGVLGAAIAIFIPGIGPVISAGILAAVLGGAAIGGAAGNFFGAFTEMGIPAEPARHYEHAIRKGYTIVTVKTQDHQQEAITILREHGAHDIQTH